MLFQNDTHLVNDTPFTNLVSFQVLVLLFKIDLSFLPITSVTQLVKAAMRKRDKLDNLRKGRNQWLHNFSLTSY